MLPNGGLLCQVLLYAAKIKLFIQLSMLYLDVGMNTIHQMFRRIHDLIELNHAKDLPLGYEYDMMLLL